MTINNEVQKPDDATLIIKRTLNAPQELVFKVWTSPEHIKHWMRPESDFSIPLAIMDLRVGGKLRIQMQKPDGEYFTAAGVFKEVKAPERLVYTWDWEKDGSGTEFGELEGKTTEITVEFFKRGKQTELVMTHSRFASVESRNNHANGWSAGLDSFVKYAEKQ